MGSASWCRPLFPSTELEQALELVRGCRHHRQPSDPDQPQIGERPLLLNLGERDRVRQSLAGFQIHHNKLRVLALGVGICLGNDLGHPYHGLLVTGVVNQHPVTRLHLPQMLQSEAVLDAVPHRSLLAGEVVEAVGGRLGLHDPVVGHSASLFPRGMAPGLVHPHSSLVTHSPTATVSSSSTSASVRPDRLRTWNEWSPPSTRCSVARWPSRWTRDSSSFRSAKSSRVPCKKSIGTSTRARCSARVSPGRPGGCSGKPRKTSPRTPGSGCAACAVEVMRPPNDLPPATRGSACVIHDASATAARTVAAATAGGSGRRARCSM